jgi:hypothetical protein
VDNYDDVARGTARERLIGLTNRVIAGILVHTTRMSYDNCDDSRFSKIESNCASGISTASYGVDPVFVMGSSLFDPDLDNVKSLLLHYNCSKLPRDQQVWCCEKILRLSVSLHCACRSRGRCLCVGVQPCGPLHEHRALCEPGTLLCKPFQHAQRSLWFRALSSARKDCWLPHLV